MVQQTGLLSQALSGSIFYQLACQRSVFAYHFLFVCVRACVFFLCTCVSTCPLTFGRPSAPYVFVSDNALCMRLRLKVRPCACFFSFLPFVLLFIDRSISPSPSLSLPPSPSLTMSIAFFSRPITPFISFSRPLSCLLSYRSMRHTPPLWVLRQRVPGSQPWG